MDSLTERIIHTAYGDKSIAVHVMDILSLNEELDVMTVSAFYHSYYPNKGTMIEAIEFYW